MIMNHPIKDIQFLFDLKTLIREKNSLNNCLRVGFINSPFSSFQPYEGVCKTSSINAILKNSFCYKILITLSRSGNSNQISSFDYINYELKIKTGCERR